MKKQLLLFVLIFLPMVANAFTGAVVIDGINYYINTDDQTAEVRANDYSGNVVIPETVEYEGVTCNVNRIGNSAFKDCYDLTSVTIPNSVTVIGTGAFGKCSSLTSITIPNSVTAIGPQAFQDCSNLAYVTIGSSVNNIYRYAFANCFKLENIYCFAANIPNIGDGIFENMDLMNLTLHVPDDYVSAYENTEPWSQFGSIMGLGDGVVIDGIIYNINTEDKTAEVGRNKLTGHVVIPETIFYEGESYTVTSIGEYAFSYSSPSPYIQGGISSITIPSTVTSIGGHAFEGCTRLTSVHISDLAAWCGITFNSGSNPLGYAHHLYLNGEEVKDLVIPNSVTSISDYAFYGCTNLTSVTIPESVNSIGNEAFYNCSGLTSVHISDLAAWCNISFAYSSNPLSCAHHLYLNGEEVKDLVVPNSVSSISDYAFCGCTGLTSVTIPESVIVIGGGAFENCTGLTSIDIPNSVTSIGYYAFYGCSSLTSITIGNSVTSIGNYAFYNCSGLTSVTIPESVNSIGDSAFDGCTSLTSVHISDLAAWCGITFNSGSNPLSYAHHLYLNGEEVKDLVIPNSVSSIGNYAFDGCTNLTSVTIPESVTSIGNEAFQNCEQLTDVYCYAEIVPSTGDNIFNNIPCSLATLYVPASSVSEYENTDPWSQFGSILKLGGAMVVIDGINYYINTEDKTAVVESNSYAGNVVIPETIEYEGVTCRVTNIAPRAFQDCSNLTSVTIGNAVTSIGEWLFSGCTGLTSVIIGSSVTSIGDFAFYDCSSLTSVTIPESVTSINAYAFSGCSGLTSITIPNSVTSIGDGAFSNCTRLTSVTIGSSVTEIGDHAFGSDGRLRTVYCHAEEVPFLIGDVFDHINLGRATLYVPANSVSEYADTYTWNQFGTIVGMEKCATPTITYANGKVRFACETENVEFVRNLSFTTNPLPNGNEMEIGGTFTISVYAKKVGHIDSDISTKTVTINLGQMGDLDGDGQLTITDVTSLVNAILGK